MSTKKDVSLSAIRDALRAGKSRKEIKAEFGLVGEQAKAVFNHPAIKGFRVKKTGEATVNILTDIPEEEWMSNKKRATKTAAPATDAITSTGSQAVAPEASNAPAPTGETAYQLEPQPQHAAPTEQPGGMW